MPIAENDRDDEDEGNTVPIHLRSMQVHHCGPGQAGNPTSGEQIAILTFLFNHKLEQPIMLSLAEVRRLLAKLVNVLEHHDDPMGKKLAMLFFPNGEWPNDAAGDVPAKPRRAVKHRARPSVRPNTPGKPVSESEVWQMVCMLRNVRDHDTFMRMIGVAEADMPVAATASKAKRRSHSTSKHSGSGRTKRKSVR